MEMKPLGVEIRHLNHAVKRMVDLQMQPITPGLSGTEGMMLRSIARQGGTTTASDIMSVSRVNKSSTSQMLSQLTRKGFVKMELDKFDHRKKNISLTAEGYKAVESMREVLQACEARMIEGISEDEIEAFRAVVAKIRKNCNAEETE